MYINPSMDIHLDEDDFNMSKINFTWKAKSFEKNKLVFQLTFNNASYISPNAAQDKLVIHLKNETFTRLFTSEDNYPMRLHRNWWTLTNWVPRQMENSEFNQ